MFILEKKDFGKNKWYRIWTSDDGADTANYLKQCVENEHKGGEYRLTYKQIVQKPLSELKIKV